MNSLRPFLGEKELLGEGPDGAWQDWAAQHVTLEQDIRRVRIYTAARQSDPRLVQLMANREYEILRGLHHPGILEADSYTTAHELGPAVLFRREPGEVRFDFWLKERGASLTLDVRLELIRQIAEALRYAHSRRIIHRTLSPQSILVTQPDAAHNFATSTGRQSARSTPHGQPDPHPPSPSTSAKCSKTPPLSTSRPKR